MINRIKRTIASNLDDRTFLFIKYFRNFGRVPNLWKPNTFNEHILLYKLSTRGNAEMIPMVDKIEAKRIVADKVGDNHVIPTLWFGETLPPLRDRNWQKPYVLKSSHSCGQNIFIRSDEDENWDKIEAETTSWLRSIYGHTYREWAYAKIPPRLLVEPYIGNGDVLPVDYKFFVFDGSAKMIQVDSGRATDHRRDLFDVQWRKLNFGLEYPIGGQRIPPPDTLSKMIEIAERLGRGLTFVRCDLYEVNGSVYFGELTFFPGAGMERFNPSEADITVGAMWSS